MADADDLNGLRSWFFALGSWLFSFGVPGSSFSVDGAAPKDNLNPTELGPLTKNG
jgi:hypothetical protein